MTCALHLALKTAPSGCRNPTLRLADLLETYAQELRDEAAGGIFVTAPGYTARMNGDSLEVLNELP